MTDEAKALVERLRDDLPQTLIEKHWVDDNDAIYKQREEAADLIEELDRHLTLSGKVSKALSDRIETLETQLESANEALRERLDICETQAREIERKDAALRLFLALIDDPDYDFGELCEEFVPIARAALAGDSHD